MWSILGHIWKCGQVPLVDSDLNMDRQDADAIISSFTHSADVQTRSNDPGIHLSDTGDATTPSTNVTTASPDDSARRASPSSTITYSGEHRVPLTKRRFTVENREVEVPIGGLAASDDSELPSTDASCHCRLWVPRKKPRNQIVKRARDIPGLMETCKARQAFEDSLLQAPVGWCPEERIKVALAAFPLPETGSWVMDARLGDADTLLGIPFTIWRGKITKLHLKNSPRFRLGQSVLEAVCIKIQDGKLHVIAFHNSLRKVVLRLLPLDTTWKHTVAIGSPLLKAETPDLFPLERDIGSSLLGVPPRSLCCARSVMWAYSDGDSKLALVCISSTLRGDVLVKIDKRRLGPGGLTLRVSGTRPFIVDDCVDLDHSITYVLKPYVLTQSLFAYQYLMHGSLEPDIVIRSPEFEHVTAKTVDSGDFSLTQLDRRRPAFTATVLHLPTGARVVQLEGVYRHQWILTDSSELWRGFPVAVKARCAENVLFVEVGMELPTGRPPQFLITVAQRPDATPQLRAVPQSVDSV
ncbi:MAG: uncharacterized protein KVP18_001598 [Porospora cf. gigantea A]|uniref:uncharacterized protein n=1 Tax=Porospora cf. gigantea A TaxID=2853593 RepID=UPI003559DF26|nr:MAG: hypothetical protein KVP18_001598 [Porospora cf. gigantea A]